MYDMYIKTCKTFNKKNSVRKLIYMKYVRVIFLI